MKINRAISLLLCSVTLSLCACKPVNDFIIANIKQEETTYTKLFNGVYINHEPGIYTGNSLTLDFKLDDPDAKLYYAIGGDLPHQSESQLFKSPITIRKTTSRDISFYPLTTSVDGVLSNIDANRCISSIYNNNVQIPGNYRLYDKQVAMTITYVSSKTTYTRSLSYIFNDDPDFYKIPVVSLVMPYNDWFGSTGLYNKIRDEIDKRVNFEFFDPTTNESLYYNSKIKIGGNWSKGYPQRTLNLNWNKDEHGNKNTPCKYPLFTDRKMCGNPEKDATNYTRMRLWNAGNSFEADTGFNDAILQRLMNGTNISTTEMRPCVAYLNGEYWGVYYMREHYADVFFQQHYGVDKDDVSVVEYKGSWLYDDGEETAALDTLDEIDRYLRNNSLAIKANYEFFIDKYIDVDSLIDVMIAQSFAGNWDFVGNNNNLKAWVYAGDTTSNPYTDGRVRFCLHDADFAFTSTNDYINVNSPNSYQQFFLFKQLLNSLQFKVRMYARAKELVETKLSAYNAIKTLDQMITEVRPYKLDHAYRWGWDKTEYQHYWMDCVNNTFDLFKTRGAEYLVALRADLGV